MSSTENTDEGPDLNTNNSSKTTDNTVNDVIARSDDTSSNLVLGRSRRQQTYMHIVSFYWNGILSIFELNEKMWKKTKLQNCAGLVRLVYMYIFLGRQMDLECEIACVVYLPVIYLLNTSLLLSGFDFNQ